jgi:hypothetical protein
MAAAQQEKELLSSVVDEIRRYAGSDPLRPWLRYASPCLFSLFDRSANSPVGFLGGFGRWRRRFRRRSCGRSFPGSSRSAPRSSTTTPGTATTPATSASGSSWSASRPTRLLTAIRQPHPHHLPMSPFVGNKFYRNVILPIFHAVDGLCGGC